MDYKTRFETERLAKDIFARLNNFVDLQNTLKSIIAEIKAFTKVDAISVRLFEEGDYPYFVSEGFAQSFIDHENSLLSENKNKKSYQQGDVYQLDCLCGLAIRGDKQLLDDFRTGSGSVWMNNSSLNVPEATGKVKNVKVRNYCNACGYESIGLFLIKVRDENIGLLQLNHQQKDFFTEELTHLIDAICQQIGVAIENAMLFEKLKNRNRELENTVNKFTDMQELLMQAKKTSVLADMVASMAHEIYSPMNKAYSSATQALEIAYNLAEKDTGYGSEINKLTQNSKTSLKSIEEVRELIMGFKAIAMDQFQESRQLINLKEFITTLTKVIKPSFTEIDVDFVIKSRKRIEVMSYSGVLSQVLTQLINNSYQHGFRDELSGVIEISCKTLPGDFIEISYADNGKGLESETSHKIFEAFFTTDRKNHMGLGLTIAENLVTTKLKGTIEVDRTSDESLAFVIKFPY